MEKTLKKIKMSNTTNKTKNRSFSKFLGLRRKSLSAKRPAVFPQNFNFVKQNHGSLQTSTISPGIIKVVFSSKATGKSAFAFGPTMGEAYRNMISKFNLKYTY